jgi:hypothetical protein
MLRLNMYYQNDLPIHFGLIYYGGIASALHSVTQGILSDRKNSQGNKYYHKKIYPLILTANFLIIMNARSRLIW